MSNPEQYTDSRGVKIQMGDVIVWPVRRQSTMTLKSGTVCETPGNGCAVKQGVVCLNERGRRVIIQRPDRCAVVQRREA